MRYTNRGVIRLLSLAVITGALLVIGLVPDTARAACNPTCMIQCPLDVDEYCANRGCVDGVCLAPPWGSCTPYGLVTVDCGLI